jgi:hypothetical protein
MNTVLDNRLPVTGSQAMFEMSVTNTKRVALSPVHAMKTLTVEVYLHSFLTLELDTITGIPKYVLWNPRVSQNPVSETLVYIIIFSAMMK